MAPTACGWQSPMLAVRLAVGITTLLLCAFAPPAVANAAAGLVAAYAFEESSGSTTADATGGGHTGTLSGATRSSSGKYGSAVSFDGVNDWVTVAHAADLNLAGGMTLEVWIRPTAAGGWRTAILKEAPSNLAYALYTS